jgi:hypothetical protein
LPPSTWATTPTPPRAVAGQLAGACYGLSGIPAEWRAGLAQQERVEQAARRLLGDGGPLER